MSLRLRTGLWCLLALTLSTGCSDDTSVAATTAPDSSPAAPPPATTNTPVPKFDRDSAYAYVAAQVAYGPRVPNTEAHRQTKEYLADKLSEFGAEVIRQDFTATAYDGTELNSTNIIGRFAPERSDRILLAAHWDTRPMADSPLEDDPNAVVNGADDGASGVGVLLEIARQIGQAAPNIGVDIVLLDAEDYGEAQGGNTNSWGLGAQYYSKNLPPRKPRYGILLDMVGAEDARFAIEGYSAKYAPDVVRKVWRLANQMGYGAYYVNEQDDPVVDDHYFINTIAGIPTIDIINRRRDTRTGFVEHWHTGNDDLEAINKRTLRAVGQVVLATVFREGDGTI